MSKKFNWVNDHIDLDNSFGSYDIMRGCVFTLTEEHLKLIQNMYFEWNDGAYDGAPYVGSKRPYGNSWVAGDVMDIIGFRPMENASCDCNNDDEPCDECYEVELSESEEEYLLRIHKETHLALKIITQLKTFMTGDYIYDSHNIWVKSEMILRKEKALERKHKIDIVLDED